MYLAPDCRKVRDGCEIVHRLPGSCRHAGFCIGDDRRQTGQNEHQARPVDVGAKAQRHRVAAVEKHAKHHDGVAVIDADFKNRQGRGPNSWPFPEDGFGDETRSDQHTSSTDPEDAIFNAISEFMIRFRECPLEGTL